MQFSEIGFPKKGSEQVTTYSGTPLEMPGMSY